MACYKPLSAYKLLNQFTENGKNRIIVLGNRDREDYESKEEAQYVELACGQCIGCRIARSKAWALRCVHEASLYEFNCFITLTYCDGQSIEHYDCKHDVFHNPTGTLVKKHFQDFMKRFRAKFSGMSRVYGSKNKFPIRYFMCGEYGELLMRPHFHACIFNFDFIDKKLWSVRNGIKLYRSADLEKLWPFGFSTVGHVTAESAAYIARYVTKKVNGDEAFDHYKSIDIDTGEVKAIEPEYITMSRRPGIAKRWFDKFGKDIYNNDFITDQGKRYQVPRYYDKIYDGIDEKHMQIIKAKRKEKANEIKEHRTNERLVVKEKVCKGKFKIKERKLENDKASVQYS